MKVVVFVVAFLVLVGIFLFVAKRKQSGGMTAEVPYYGKSPLTEVEQVLYYRLVEALPELVVLAQVPLTAILGIKKRQNKSWQGQFNAISRKSVDYVVCRKDFSIVAVIELDDSTHEKPERQKSDEVKNAAFKAVGIEVLRLKPGKLPEAASIQMAFNTLLKTATASASVPKEAVSIQSK